MMNRKDLHFRSISAIAAAVIVASPGLARASTCPTAGQIQINAGVPQYCDGSSWNTMQGNSVGSCSGAGQTQVSSTDFTFCDGSTSWTMKGPSLGSCSTSAHGQTAWNGNMLTVCVSGTLYSALTQGGVIAQAFQAVYGRMPMPQELSKWQAMMNQSPMSYAVLVSTIKQEPQPQIYVSANGNDSNFGGSQGSAVQTVSKALALAANYYQNGAPSGGAMIYLRGGSYSLYGQPIVLGPQNSGQPGAPLTISSYPGESAVLTGALSFQGNSAGSWSMTTVNTVSGPEPVMVYTFSDPVRTQLANQIAAIKAGYNAGRFAITELFMNGARMVRSRHPNSDADVDARYVHAAGSGCDNGVAQSSMQPYLGIPSAMTAAHPFLSGQDGTEFIFSNLWQQPRALVQGSDLYGVSLAYLNLGDVTSVCWSGFETEKGHFENNLAFVDSLHEWFFDEQNIQLYFITSPSDNLNTATFSIPLSHNLIRLQGSPGNPVHDVVLQNLAFQNSSWVYGNQSGAKGGSGADSTYYGYGQGAYGMSGMVYGNYVNQISIQSSQFLSYGEYGIAFGVAPTEPQNSNGGHATNVVINGNSFQDGGGGAIRIDNVDSLGAGRNVISANTVNSTGQVFADSVAIESWNTTGVVITGNTVTNVPYSGIQPGEFCRHSASDYNEVSNNTVSQAMTRLRDGGGIYISTQNGVAQNNTVSGTSREPDAPAWSADFERDIYLDDYASWWKVTGNAAAYISSKSSKNFLSNNRQPLSVINNANPGVDGIQNCPQQASQPTWW